jgi:hypothetical protein
VWQRAEEVEDRLYGWIPTHLWLSQVEGEVLLHQVWVVLDKPQRVDKLQVVQVEQEVEQEPVEDRVVGLAGQDGWQDQQPILVAEMNKHL